MRQLSLRRLDVSDSRHHHTKALIYVTAVELSQSILTCLLFSLHQMLARRYGLPSILTH